MLPVNPPTPELQPFVAGYACIDVPLLPGQRHQARATPLGCPAILLLDQGDIRITDGPAAGQRTPPATFVGQLTRSGGHDYTGPIHGFLIQLAPAGGHDLLGCAMPRFANASVPMQQALPPELAGSLENVVHASTDFAARCAAADAVLLAWARQRRARPGLGAAAAELLMNSQGQLEIEEVAARLDVSARTLLRLFTRQVGMSPKNFARLMRFRAAHAYLQQPEARWADAVCQFGYTDQSHLIRDYRDFAGETPRHYQHEGRPIDRLLRELDNPALRAQ